MKREQIKEGRKYSYRTHNSHGTFVVGQVYRDENTHSWWVIGFDKFKQRNITVRPSQIQ